MGKWAIGMQRLFFEEINYFIYLLCELLYSQNCSLARIIN